MSNINLKYMFIVYLRGVYYYYITFAKDKLCWQYAFSINNYVRPSIFIFFNIIDLSYLKSEIHTFFSKMIDLCSEMFGASISLLFLCVFFYDCFYDVYIYLLKLKYCHFQLISFACFMFYLKGIYSNTASYFRLISECILAIQLTSFKLA